MVGSPMGLAGTGLGGPARPGLHLSAVWPADLDAGLRNRVGAVSAGDGQGTVQIGLSHDLWLDGLGLVIRELELFLPVHAVFDPLSEDGHVQNQVGRSLRKHFSSAGTSQDRTPVWAYLHPAALA